jgi:phage-related tail fiber protein
MEVELFGIHAGRVAVGEVKASGSGFTDDQIAHDIEACTKLRADLYVMAAMDTIAEQAHATASSLCQDATLDLIVLTADLFDTHPATSPRPDQATSA